MASAWRRAGILGDILPEIAEYAFKNGQARLARGGQFVLRRARPGIDLMGRQVATEGGGSIALSNLNGTPFSLWKEIASCKMAEAMVKGPGRERGLPAGKGCS